jgi:endonuclease YncB( thermonuclease family)
MHGQILPSPVLLRAVLASAPVPAIACAAWASASPAGAQARQGGGAGTPPINAATVQRPDGQTSPTAGARAIVVCAVDGDMMVVTVDRAQDTVRDHGIDARFPLYDVYTFSDSVVSPVQ